MKNLRLLLPIVLFMPLLLTGCGDSYPDEEMHLGIEDKTRPYSITLDPPEVLPGETVTVTLEYHAARPGQVEESWRVALDYAFGPYEVDEVERRLVALDDVPAPVVDDQDFMTQTFEYTVPDSVILWSTGIPEVITDAGMLMLIDYLISDQVSDPPLKTEVDQWFRSLTDDDLAAMDPQELMAAQRLADLFACQVRFRVTLDANMTVDVTRNLTVRYSGKLASGNVNANAEITRFAVGMLDKVDIDVSDLDEHEDDIVWFEFDGTSENGWPEARVPNHGNSHTYFIRVRFAPEEYTSPFELDRMLEEQGEYFWYYYRLDAPGSGHYLYADEEGEETEMFELDEDVRLLPPGGNSSYRLVSVVRDVRSEWQQYYATPGATVTVGEVVFEAE